MQFNRLLNFYVVDPYISAYVAQNIVPDNLCEIGFLLGDQITFRKSIQFVELIEVKNCSPKIISQIISSDLK